MEPTHFVFLYALSTPFHLQFMACTCFRLISTSHLHFLRAATMYLLRNSSLRGKIPPCTFTPSLVIFCTIVSQYNLLSDLVISTRVSLVDLHGLKVCRADSKSLNNFQLLSGSRDSISYAVSEFVLLGNDLRFERVEGINRWSRAKYDGTNIFKWSCETWMRS